MSTPELNLELLKKLKRLTLQRTRGGGQQYNVDAIGQALGQDVDDPSVPAVANVSNQPNVSEILTVVARGDVNRILYVSPGPATAVEGRLYYKQLSDLTGEQSVVASFGAGMVVMSIGPTNSRAWFTGEDAGNDICDHPLIGIISGEWEGENYQPAPGTGTWY
ncbi:hypothetical protein FRC10_001567 [Ceratobasidium sp. 414]|nr:hypothetical protein FRC10_001567 [Ceratobasidium sp. 414]